MENPLLVLGHERYKVLRSNVMATLAPGTIDPAISLEAWIEMPMSEKQRVIHVLERMLREARTQTAVDPAQDVPQGAQDHW